MANGMYQLALQSFLSQSPSINMSSDNIKVALVKTGGGHYVVNLATDQFLGVAIAAGDIVARTANLASKTETLGVFLAANTVFSAVPATTACGAIVIYKDTGTDNTCPLIAYIDSYAGLPVTPNGSDINVTWPSSGNGSIFSI